MKLLRQKLFSSLDPSIVLEFLGRLSGFVSRAKSLHWAARGKDIHEYLDGLWKEIYEFQDTVAEGFMGISGQFAAQDVPYVAAEERRDPQAFIKEVESKTLEFYEELPADDPRYKGLCGETESFIQTVEKYKYLFSLCAEEREFSEKKERSKAEKVAAGATVGLSGLGLASVADEVISARRLAKKEGKKVSDIYKEMAEKEGERKLERIYKRGAKAQYDAQKVQHRIEGISTQELEAAKKAYERAKQAAKDRLKEIDKTSVGKILKKGRRTDKLIAAAIGTSLVGTGIAAYKNKKENDTTKK